MKYKRMYQKHYGDWKPKRGDKVFCCYDGKYGRRVVGTVIKQQGCTLTVSFTDYDDEIHTMTANRIRGGSYAGWAVHDGALMTKMFGSSACPGDWYSIFPYTSLTDV